MKKILLEKTKRFRFKNPVVCYVSKHCLNFDYNPKDLSGEPDVDRLSGYCGSKTIRESLDRLDDDLYKIYFNETAGLWNEFKSMLKWVFRDNLVFKDTNVSLERQARNNGIYY